MYVENLNLVYLIRENVMIRRCLFLQEMNSYDLFIKKFSKKNNTILISVIDVPGIDYS